MVKGREFKYPLSRLSGAERLDWNDVSVFLALTRHRNLTEPKAHSCPAGSILAVNFNKSATTNQ